MQQGEYILHPVNLPHSYNTRRELPDIGELNARLVKLVITRICLTSEGDIMAAPTGSAPVSQGFKGPRNNCYSKELQNYLFFSRLGYSLYPQYGLICLNSGFLISKGFSGSKTSVTSKYSSYNFSKSSS